MTGTQLPPVPQISLGKRFSGSRAPRQFGEGEKFRTMADFGPTAVATMPGAAPARWAQAIGTHYSSNALLGTYCRFCVLL